MEYGVNLVEFASESLLLFVARGRVGQGLVQA